MDLNKQQIYEAYMRKASEIVINWHQLKPDNKEIKHLLDCLAAVANHTAELNRELITANKLNEESASKVKSIAETMLTWY